MRRSERYPWLLLLDLTCPTWTGSSPAPAHRARRTPTCIVRVKRRSRRRSGVGEGTAGHISQASTLRCGSWSPCFRTPTARRENARLSTEKHGRLLETEACARSTTTLHLDIENPSPGLPRACACWARHGSRLPHDAPSDHLPSRATVAEGAACLLGTPLPSVSGFPLHRSGRAAAGAVPGFARDPASATSCPAVKHHSGCSAPRSRWDVPAPLSGCGLPAGAYRHESS